MSAVVRAKSKTRPAGRLTYPPCLVCGGESSGLHYGCTTCEACKNFYRRYLLRKKPYDCPKNNTCEISVNNKINCSACRLAKCVQLGMCKTRCKLGRYDNSRKTEVINMMKQLDVTEPPGQHTPQTPAESSTCREMSPAGGAAGRTGPDVQYDETVLKQITENMANIKPFTIDLDNEEVRNSIVSSHHEKYTRKNEVFGTMRGVPMAEYRTLLRDFNIDLDGYYEAMERMVEPWEGFIGRYSDFTLSMPGFNQLNTNDQENLVKASFLFASTYLVYKCWSPEYNILIETNGQPFHLEEYCDKFVSRAHMEAAADVYTFLQKLKLTKEEEALLLAIATFSSSVCKLENAALVEAIQLRYVTLLRTHLDSRLGQREASRRFAKLLDSLTRIGHIAHINSSELKSFAKDDLVLKLLPDIEAFIPEEA